MKQVNLVLLILLCVEGTDLQLVLNHIDKPSALTNLLVQIIKKNFFTAQKMAIRYSKKFFEVNEIVRFSQIPVTINAEEKAHFGLDKRNTNDVVLLLQKTVNVTHWLKVSLWNFETRFLLVLKNLDQSERELKKIFKTFWKANILNVYIILYNNLNFLIYTYTPFVYQKCNDINLHQVDIEAEDYVLRNKMENLGGCLINVTAVDLPPMVIFPDRLSRNGTLTVTGTEANIIYEISKKLKFIPRFAVARDGEAWGWIQPSPHGAVGDVYKKYSQYAFGLLATTLERYERLDMTVPVCPIRECITWAVPVGAAKAQATWIQSYVQGLTIFMWTAIVLAFFIGTIIFWKFRMVYKSTSAMESMLFMFSVFLNVPVKLPSQNPLRTFVLAWTWYSFITVTAYQSLMGSKLTVPFRPRDIDTIRDLLESDLHFTGFYNTFRLVSHENEGNLKKVITRLEATKYGIEEAIKYIIYNRSIAYMRETTSFKYYTIRNPNAKGNVHFMKECAYQYYPIMVLQRNSPLTKKSNEIISRLFESGILIKWRSRYIYEVSMPPPSAVQLSLDHLFGPLMLLFIGLIFSFVVFILENL